MDVDVQHVLIHLSMLMSKFMSTLHVRAMLHIHVSMLHVHRHATQTGTYSMDMDM
jgi:hypothetical protein